MPSGECPLANQGRAGFYENDGRRDGEMVSGTVRNPGMLVVGVLMLGGNFMVAGGKMVEFVHQESSEIFVHTRRKSSGTTVCGVRQLEKG